MNIRNKALILILVLTVALNCGASDSVNDSFCFSGKDRVSGISQTVFKTESSTGGVNGNGKRTGNIKRVEITFGNKVVFKEDREQNAVALKQADMLGGTDILFETLLGNGENIRNTVNYLYPELYDKIEKILKEYEKEPINAKANISKDENGVKFSYTDEAVGKMVDRYGLYKKLFEKAKIASAQIVIADIEPEIKREELEECDNFIARAETDYSSSPSGRKHNIEMASSAIFGLEISDGEIFSFNETVGERTKERGYEKAKTIIEGRYVEDYGGGVCQVATTLFNALLKAGLTIVESSCHSIAPSYVGIARDAMVSSFTDLKMKNETGKPIFITGTADGAKLSFEIYSFERREEIRLSGRVTRVVKPSEPKYIYGKENIYGTEAGCEYAVEKGRDGYFCELYADIYEGDEFKTRKLLRRNYYPSSNAVYYIYSPDGQFEEER